MSDGWDTYWQGTRYGGAYTGGGSPHPSIVSFWTQAFAEVRLKNGAPRIVDVASGNGALVEHARKQFGDDAHIVCLDASEAAVRGLAKRFSTADCIVADAGRLPLVSGCAELVVSQFGVEYAGSAAVGEAARLVVPCGQLVLLLHHRGGGIYRQCSASVDAVQQLQAAEFIPRAIELFEAGFAAMRSGNRGRYETAAREMAPAVRAVESIIGQQGAQVADGTIVRLLRDVKTMHERMPNYDAADVLGWLSGMQEEMAAYAGRMSSMCDAAIGQRRFDALCADLQRCGFELSRAEPLVDPERGNPIAWSLMARRS